ncbi:MAG TPA: hypothetical protein VH593_32075 [Ktedonobacteraceae bacterium]
MGVLARFLVDQLSSSSERGFEFWAWCEARLLHWQEASFTPGYPIV